MSNTAAGGDFNEGETSILIDRDFGRNDQAVLVLRLGVKRLAELHNVNAVLTECRSDWRRWIRLPSGALQLYDCHYLLSHCLLFSSPLAVHDRAVPHLPLTVGCNQRSNSLRWPPMTCSALGLFHIRVVQNNRRCAPENLNHYTKLFFVFQDFINEARKICERTRNNSD